MRTFACLIPQYAWLADQGFVPVDKTPSDAEWKWTEMQMVGPDFSFKFINDRIAATVQVGSDSVGWLDMWALLDILCPEETAEGGLLSDWSTVPQALQKHLGQVRELFLHGDLAQAKRDVERYKRKLYRL
ncbi:MAG: hypothetical protein R3C46_10500 [Hyphomonadaceae bacterium]